MQKSVMVDRISMNEHLNSLLSDGWKVINTCPMPSSNCTCNPTCLVIIEREEEE